MKVTDKDVRDLLTSLGVEGGIFPVKQVGEPVQHLVLCSRLSYRETMLTAAKLTEKLWGRLPQKVSIIFGEPTEYVFEDFSYKED